jgi:hypothetical protein
MIITQSEKEYDYIVILFGILTCLSFLGGIFEQSLISSVCFYISFFLIFWLVFVDVIKYDFIPKSIILLLIFMLLSIIVNVSFEIDYFKRFIIVLSAFVCFEKGPEVSRRTSGKAKSAVILMFLFSALITIFMYFFGGLKNKYFGSTEFVSLNFSNPNETGMWLVALFVMVSLFGLNSRNKIKLLIAIVIDVAIFIIMQATGSRNSIFACIIYLVAVVLVKLFNIKKFNRLILLFIVLLPAIVFVFYMFFVLVRLDYFTQLFESFISEGKGLTSRGKIWQIVIDDFWKCFILGDYATYNTEQMHNSIATLYAMFGMPCTVLMTHIMYKCLLKLQRLGNLTAVLSLGAILLTGCFEASIFVGVAGLYLVVLLIPVCSKVEN